MVFSSSVFLFIFLPVVFCFVYMIHFIGARSGSCPSAGTVRAENAFLLMASLFFYAWGEPVYILLLCFSALVNYLIALPAEKNGISSRNGRAFVAAGYIFNIGMLVLFKYSGLPTLSPAPVSAASSAVSASRCGMLAHMPVGISFYTFQSMSYVVDAYRGKVPVQKNYARLLLYISFFPQLIAGPIVRYGCISAQIERRELSERKLASGLRRFVFGLAKKVIIADGAGLLADNIFALPESSLCAASAWLAAVAYCIQIYYDFSGYSDMAIGLSRMAGFDIAENFNYPYTAVSMRDFWKRWHISLSAWFREYVYIPLGGNRKGRLRTGVNRLLVFLLTGIWHGAALNFAAWGLFHGILIMLETYGVIRPERFRPKLLSRVYTLLSVCLAFVLFRSESFGRAFIMFRAMFTGFAISPEAADSLVYAAAPFSLFCALLGTVFSAPLLRPMYSFSGAASAREKKLSAAGYIISVPLYIVCVFSVIASSYDPFIYFRF